MESVLLLSGLPQRTRTPRPLQLVAVSRQVRLRGVVAPHHGAGAACAKTKTSDPFAVTALRLSARDRQFVLGPCSRAGAKGRPHKTAPMTSVFEIPSSSPSLSVLHHFRKMAATYTADSYTCTG